MLFVEGESSVSIESCDLEAFHSEFGVSNDESQSKSPGVMKVNMLCSIGTETDDSTCSCNSFEGIVPYRKPIIHDVQMYQTQNVWGTKG